MIPQEEAHNRTYIFEHRLRILFEKGILFENLRHAQIRSEEILRVAESDAAVEAIFEVRADLLVALEELIEAPDMERNEDPDYAALLRSFRKTVYSRGNNEDELHLKLEAALASLREALGPISRLEAEQ